MGLVAGECVCLVRVRAREREVWCPFPSLSCTLGTEQRPEHLSSLLSFPGIHGARGSRTVGNAPRRCEEVPEQPAPLGHFWDWWLNKGAAF